MNQDKFDRNHVSQPIFIPNPALNLEAAARFLKQAAELLRIHTHQGVLDDLASIAYSAEHRAKDLRSNAELLTLII